MTRKLDMVEQLGSLATDAHANTATISETCASILAALDRLVVPIGDPARGRAGRRPPRRCGRGDRQPGGRPRPTPRSGGRIAGVNSRIDDVKNEIRGPVEAVQREGRQHRRMARAPRARSARRWRRRSTGTSRRFSEGLAGCTNIEQVIDLIIGQVSDLTGMPKFTVPRDPGGVAQRRRLHRPVRRPRARRCMPVPPTSGITPTSWSPGAGADQAIAPPPGPPDRRQAGGGGTARAAPHPASGWRPDPDRRRRRAGPRAGHRAIGPRRPYHAGRWTIPSPPSAGTPSPS